MDNRQNQVTVIKAFLSNIKKNSFVDGYEATDEEAMGLLLASLFEWDGKAIMKSCAWALEDANFHTECEKIMEMAK
jgi:hypothetical protein